MTAADRPAPSVARGGGAGPGDGLSSTVGGHADALASGAAPLAGDDGASVGGGHPPAARSGPARPVAAPTFWRDPEKRALVWQALLILAVAALVWGVAHNTATNMAARGLASGFGFLDVRAGFDIIATPFVPYGGDATYLDVFLVGLVNTLIVAVIGCALAVALGFVVGIARLSGNWLVAKLATFYIELFRNIPLLLQLLFWYVAVLQPLPGPRELHEAGDSVFFSINNRGLIFADPVAQPGFRYVVWAALAGVAATLAVRAWARVRQVRTGEQFPVLLTGIALIAGLPALVFLILERPIELVPAEMSRFALRGGVTIIPELVALLLALVIYTAAFIAEIVRAGIESVGHGQSEAASALGLRPNLRMRLVVVPQALRVIVPPLTSQFLNLTKNSSLATAIAYPDLFAVFAGTTLNQTGQAVEVMAMTLLVYLTLSLLTSGFMNWYNSRIKLVER